MKANDGERTGVVEEDGLLFGCRLDGAGGANLIGWSELENWRPGDGPVWVHLDQTSTRVEQWLRGASGLTEATIDALLADETRPRVFRGKRGFVAILRGLNFNPGDVPEDMVAIHMWSDGELVITIRHFRLMTPRDILAQLIETGDGPRSASELFERLITRLTERMASTIASYSEALDALEEDFDISKATVMRRSLSSIRQNTVMLRRYLSPQREALNSILLEPAAWLEDSSRLRLREAVDTLIRYLEELDATRERALVLKDDIANELAETTNKTLYILAIISAIFLPLGFLTGLMGINIGGMPGVESDAAFWIFTAVMIILIAAELLLFRRLKWL